MGLMQFVIKQFISHLGKTAKAHNGFQTASYSQALEPVNTIIGKHETSREGICEATSARWIVMHAQGDSLFNWIYDQNGKINRAAIVNLSVNQIDGETRGRSQDFASERYLFSHGLQRRTEIAAGAGGLFTRKLTEGTKAGGGNIGHQLPAAMTASKLITGYYVMIGIHGSGGGHCMAAYIGEDVCFFDPNFGEYWFPKRTDFIKWFHSSFWLPYRIGNLDDSFGLREYAMKMSFVKEHGKVNNRYVTGKV